VSVADDVGVGVGDGQAVHPLLFVDVLVDRIAIRAENDTTVAVLRDIFVSVFEILVGIESCPPAVSLTVNPDSQYIRRHLTRS
jgi:hypothetical protein